MAYTVVGLGNPGEEYDGTRHNTGRIVLEKLENEGEASGKSGGLALEKVATAKFKGVKFMVLDDYMNNSGPAVAKAMAGKSASRLIIIHDDLDLALGIFKISFNKGPGGHRGVASIIKSLKTQEFTRVRVGISPTTPSGKIKKPVGSKKVLDFILGKFKPNELIILKKVSKKIGEAIFVLTVHGREVAMSQFNK